MCASVPRWRRFITLLCAACIVIAASAQSAYTADSRLPTIGSQPGAGGPVKELPARQYQPPPPVPAEQTLIMPPNWHPSWAEPMPPVPQAMTDFTIPDPYIGCWKGRAAGFDQVYYFEPLEVRLRSGIGPRLGEPGEITFCYHPHAVEVRHAQVVVPATSRALEFMLLFGLGHHTFEAHGIQTEIYSVSPTEARGRTTLDVDPTLHLFHVIPLHGSPQPSKVDWRAIAVAPGTLRVNAYQVHWGAGAPHFAGTWHAEFSRVGPYAGQ